MKGPNGSTVGDEPGLGPAKPSVGVSILIFAVSVTLMACLRLWLFRNQVVALTYGVPLLLCLWHRDRRLLWSMAVTFIGMAAVKAFWLMPDPHPGDFSQITQWLMQTVNILAVGVTVDLIIRLVERLQAQNTRLAQANEELAASEEEVRQQNEELQSQSEEMAQQNEELQHQGEELERQAEEVRSQAEELHAANQELNEREGMLQTILASLRDAGDERLMLGGICRALVQLTGQSAASAAVVEKVEDQLVVREHAGAEKLRLAQWPYRDSFASLVIAQGRTAFVDDLAARPDLVVPEPAGRQFRSLLATPLRLDGGFMGAVEVYALEPRQWTKEEFRIIEWAAAQCSLALETMRLQTKLRESEERLRLAAEAANIGVWSWKPGTTEVVVSANWRSLFGVSPDAVVTFDTWREALHPEDRERAVGELSAASEQRRDFKSEYRILRPDGTMRWIVDRGRGRCDEHGRVLGMAGVNVDITEQKEAQQVLARNKAELERLVAERTAELQELVGELEHFSYTITHDMRAPLRAMQGFGELLCEECADCEREEPREFVKRISTAARRMDTLITDALNYSRAVRQELALTPIDAENLLRGMLESYPELQPASARIEIAGGIPPVLANEAGLTQCFSNLLGNAVKFAKPGQRPQIRVWAELVHRPECTVPNAPSTVMNAKPPVQDPEFAIPSHSPPSATRNQPFVAASAENGWVRIWVEDEGIGIPPAMLPRVFDMFSRGHSHHEGTGIGLALVRKVLDRMGGKVGVESELGKGSRFWLELRGVEPETPRPQPPAGLAP